MPSEAAESHPKRMRREDPPPRPVEQTANRGFLEGGDPNKHYVWVAKVNDPTINPAYYRHLGYKVSQYDPTDEAKPALGDMEYKQGDAIESMGMVLMECPLDKKLARDAEGWAKADRIQETIRNREVDPLTNQERAAFRGITSTRDSSDDRKRWEF